MGVIGHKEISLLYLFAKNISEQRCTKSNAIQELSSKYGINTSSAKDYFTAYEYMIQGKCYKRTISGDALDYYLDNILRDKGSNVLGNALKALFEHIEYYGNKTGTTPKKSKEIYDIYMEKLSKINSQEVVIDLDDNTLDYGMEIEDLEEGKSVRVTINKYERNRIARKKCIEHHGTKCLICNFKFEDVYGAIGKDFIHVHHIKPLSEISSEYKVNPVKDLIPVCPNCHAMIHKKKPCYTIEEMLNIMKK